MEEKHKCIVMMYFGIAHVVLISFPYWSVINWIGQVACLYEHFSVKVAAP
jgi:hypothetical protein